MVVAEDTLAVLRAEYERLLAKGRRPGEALAILSLAIAQLEAEQK